MELALSPTQRAELETAAGSERRVRVWRRDRAVLLRADGAPAAPVAASLGCSLSSVYGWAGAWRRDGLTGLRGRAQGARIVPLAERTGFRLGLVRMPGDEEILYRYDRDDNGFGYAFNVDFPPSSEWGYAPFRIPSGEA